MQDGGPIVLFDGVCHLCSGGVVWLARRDVRRVLRFAPMQSAEARNRLSAIGIDPDDMSSWLLLESGTVWRRSAAALRLLPYLPWYWRWLGMAGWLPERIRDGLYDVLARNRYRWFGQRETCFMPRGDLSRQFLGDDGSSQPR